MTRRAPQLLLVLGAFALPAGGAELRLLRTPTLGDTLKDVLNSRTGAAPLPKKPAAVTGSHALAPKKEAQAKTSPVAPEVVTLAKASTAAAANKTAANKTAIGEAGDRVLIYWATGATKDSVNLIKQNVKHARSQLPHVSVFLAHYDHNRVEWRNLAGQAWYDQNVDSNVEQAGYKFKLLRMVVQNKMVTISDYDWVWVLDEDADFRRTPLPRMLDLATQSGALISTPAFWSSTGEEDMSYPFQQPRRDCRYRYVQVVEVTFPLFRAEALEPLMRDCTHCMHEKSVWGFCRMWCSWSARRLGKDKHKSCAVLDAAPMVHMDFRTLDGKYEARQSHWAGRLKTFNKDLKFLEVQEEHPGHDDFYQIAIKDFMDVQKHHARDFVQGKGADMKELKCVK